MFPFIFAERVPSFACVAHCARTHLWRGYRGSRSVIECRRRQRSDIPAKSQIHFVLAARSPKFEISSREGQTLVAKLHVDILDAVLALYIDHTLISSFIGALAWQFVSIIRYGEAAGTQLKAKAIWNM